MESESNISPMQWLAGIEKEVELILSAMERKAASLDTTKTKSGTELGTNPNQLYMYTETERRFLEETKQNLKN